MITFKDIEISDIANCLGLMQEFYAIDHYPINATETTKLLETFIANKNLGQAYLIYNKEIIVGYVIMTFVFSFEYKGTLAFIDELYIKETARKQGIGTKTIEFIKQEAKNSNVKIMYLEVENHNQNAQKLYIAHYFEFHDRKIMKFLI